MADNFIVVAKFGAVHGLKGWLKLHSFTEPCDNVLDYQPWYVKIGEDYRAVVNDGHRWQGDSLLVHVQGFDTREAVHALLNQSLYIDAKQLPALPPGEYYWQQLLGLQVLNLEGYCFGRVTSLMATGANDVMMIEGDKHHCLPYLKHIIQQVDLVAATMVVDWPAEL